MSHGWARSRRDCLCVAGLHRQGMNWQCVAQHLGADAGLAAEVGEVGGEAVAEVDGGGGQTAAKQRLSDCEAGLRE